jgi:predicted enzyme related to lactoylglutathione lyase
MEQGQLIWFEIPVLNLNRAIHFYTKVFGLKITSAVLLDTEYGLIEKIKNSVSGVLVKKENHIPGNGIIFFFYAISMADALSQVMNCEGQIIKGKTLIKQKNETGDVMINNNLIDNNIGYFAEILDSEGNKLCIYSNS